MRDANQNTDATALDADGLTQQQRIDSLAQTLAGRNVAKDSDRAGQDRPIGATPVRAAEAEALPLARLIRHFAARVAGETAAPEEAGAVSLDSAELTREALIARAAELGFDLSFQPKNIRKLGPRDFPCLIALKDGRGFLATGPKSDEVLFAETPHGMQQVGVNSFEADFSGLILQLSPRIETGAEAAGEPQGAPAKGQGHKLVRQIFDHIITHNRELLAQMSVAALLSNLMLVVLPLFIMSVYDRIIPHLAFETLWALGFGVLLALLIDFGLRLSRASLLEAIALSAANRFQAQYYDRLMRLKLAETPRLAGGLSGAMQEFDNLCRTIPQLLVSIAVDLPFFLLMLGLLAYIGGAIVVAPMLGLVVIAFVNLLSYARSQENHAASARINHKRANQLVETLGAIELVKTTGGERQLLSKWERMTDLGAYIGYQARHETGLASHVTVITVQATIALTLVIGVFEVQAGAASVGALAAASLLVGRAIGPMGAFVALIARGLHMLQSAEAIAQLSDAPIEKAGDRGRKASRRFEGRLQAKGLDLSYGDGAHPVLRQLEFSIEPGERVGLIGRIGCGKTSLLKLLPRLYEPSGGSLLLDGHDIRQYDPALLRRQIALMPQESRLLDGTLRDNICFGLAEIDEQAFEQAVSLSGVKRFASLHPEGYGMQVGPGGERLSGGERASVVLARTLVRQPKILLLDEPTASMDNELERRIVQQLDSWLDGRSLILATHRAPLLALTNRLIWLHDGRIVADGSRDEILKKLQG